jgi:hypothetical protein
VRWINEIDPGGVEIKARDANRDSNIYLISSEDGFDEDTAVEWVELNFKNMFETELESWYSDPALWPKPLTCRLFQAWFEIEYHSILIDTVGTPIIDDELGPTIN